MKQSEQPATPTNGRNKQGHFTEGNPGGPGNPYARQVALLRKKVLQVIDEDKMEEIILELFELAKKGNLQAIKVLLQYTLGKPAEAQNPDLVDVEEWDQMKAASEKIFQADRVVGTPELETFLRMARVTRPGIGDEMSKKFVGKLQEDLEAEQAKQKKNKNGKKGKTTANGPNGHRMEKRAAAVGENEGPRIQYTDEEVAIINQMLEERDRLAEEDLARLTNGISAEQAEDLGLTNGNSANQAEELWLSNGDSVNQPGEQRLPNGISAEQAEDLGLTNGNSSTRESKPSRNGHKMDLKTLRRLRSLKQDGVFFNKRIFAER